MHEEAAAPGGPGTTSMEGRSTMRLVSFARAGQVQPGLWLEDGSILALADAAGIARPRTLAEGADLSSMVALIASAKASLPIVQDLAARATSGAMAPARIPAGTATLLAPIPRPGKNV